MKRTTCLFDLDGTLVDSVADLAGSVNLLRGELALPPLPVSTVRGYVGDGATMLVRRALGDALFGDAQLQRFLALYGEHLLDRTAPYPGIVEFLERHQARPMAVVTNKPLALTLELLDGLQLRRFFPVILGGDSFPEKKPHPKPVLEALRMLGADPAGAVMIGDHHTDLRAGRAAGIATCFCSWGVGHDGGDPHDFRADSPRDLLRLFP